MRMSSEPTRPINLGILQGSSWSQFSFASVLSLGNFISLTTTHNIWTVITTISPACPVTYYLFQDQIIQIQILHWCFHIWPWYWNNWYHHVSTFPRDIQSSYIYTLNPSINYVDQPQKHIWDSYIPHFSIHNPIQNYELLLSGQLQLFHNLSLSYLFLYLLCIHFFKRVNFYECHYI